MADVAGRPPGLGSSDDAPARALLRTPPRHDEADVATPRRRIRGGARRVVVAARATMGSRALTAVVLAAGALALGAHVAAMWSGFHSQDGPAHVFAAHALSRTLSTDPGLIGEVYATNLRPHPNWLTYPPLATWLGANPARIAEMMVVSLLVVGLAAAALYAMTVRRGAGAAVAVAAFPVAVGYSVHTGLYNFTAGIALVLVVVGYHLRVASRLTAGRAAVLSLLLVVLYFTHPLALVVAGLAVGVIGLAALVADGRGRWSWRYVGGRIAPLVVAALPAVALLLWFLTDPGTVPEGGERDPWRSLRATVLFRWPVQAVSGDEAAWALGLAVVTWAVSAVLLVRSVVRRRWSRWDALLVLPLVTAVSAVVVPDRLAGGTIVQPRLAIFALLFLLVWIAVAHPGGALVRATGVLLGAAGVVVLVGLLAVRVGPYAQMRAVVDEVAGVAEFVEPDTLLLGSVSRRSPEQDPAVPLVHIVDRIALDASAVNVSTLDAGTGYGPIRYRDRFGPGPALRSLPRNRTHHTEFDAERFASVTRRYAQVTRRNIDYLVIVGYDLEPSERRLFDEVGFELVHVTGPAGLARLYTVPPVPPDPDVELRP